jgi:hypothetical protein
MSQGRQFFAEFLVLYAAAFEKSFMWLLAAFGNPLMTAPAASEILLNNGI